MLSLAIPQFPFTTALVLLIGGRRLEAKSVIVDDSDTSRITYSGWGIGNNCTGCYAQPDPTQPSNGTWHNGIANGFSTPFFTFKFTGISVEARYIAMDIIETDFSFHTGTNASFSIDGNLLGTTVRNPTDRGAYVYNQSLVSIHGLSDTEHTLRVQLLKHSVLLLDYLVYDDGSEVASPAATSTSSSTSCSSISSLILGPPVSSTVNDASSTYGNSYPQTLTSTSSKPNTNIGAIVGGVVAAVIVLVLGVVLLWHSKYRSQEITQRRRPPIQPYDPNPTGSGAHSDVQMATVQGALLSGFYGTSGTVGHVAHKSQQTGRTPVPQQAVSSHKPIYPTPSPLPGNFHSDAVADGEPVEAGLMSREMSTTGALPLYGPGGVRHNEAVPPLPRQ